MAETQGEATGQLAPCARPLLAKTTSQPSRMVSAWEGALPPPSAPRGILSKRKAGRGPLLLWVFKYPRRRHPEGAIRAPIGPMRCPVAWAALCATRAGYCASGNLRRLLQAFGARSVRETVSRARRWRRFPAVPLQSSAGRTRRRSGAPARHICSGRTGGRHSLRCGRSRHSGPS